MSASHAPDTVRALRRRIANVAFVSFCTVSTVLALIALSAILWSLFSQGIGGINLNVFIKETPAAGSVGGLSNSIIGSLLMCGIGMAIALVIGILAGTWLAEFGATTRLADAVRFVNDVLLSAPSILIGLFVYQLLVAPFHGFSGFAGGVALALLALPVITRTTEDILRLQSNALREAGAALGAPQHTVVRNIIWKAASGGILTGGLLAFARISGETAPLIFTALGNQFFSLDLFKPMESLPYTIYKFALSAYDDWQRLAWTGALLIAVAVLSTNIIARALASESRRS